MRTFVLRSRKSSTDASKLALQVNSNAHIEVILHVLMNAFYYSSAMRENVDVYVVLESSPNFPKTVKFSSQNALSFSGFHEQAFLDKLILALSRAQFLEKKASFSVCAGIDVFGFGFETLMKTFESASIYLLDRKGKDIREAALPEDGVFVLSDHLAFPKNILKSLENKGATKLSLGRKMLFASQCVVLIHHELDRQGIA